VVPLRSSFSLKINLRRYTEARATAAVNEAAAAATSAAATAGSDDATVAAAIQSAAAAATSAAEADARELQEGLLEVGPGKCHVRNARAPFRARPDIRHVTPSKSIDKR